MEPKIDEVTMAALDLSIEERAHLAGKLLLGLDEPSESEVENLWMEEAECRLKEFHEGREFTAYPLMMFSAGPWMTYHELRVLAGC
jgi:hypothetical protein